MDGNFDIRRTVHIRRLHIDDVARNAKGEALSMSEAGCGHVVPDPCTIKLESLEPDVELSHLQADGFWGPEKGFHDVDEFRRQFEQQD